MEPIVWLIILVICLVVEGATLGLTTVWFAVGSLAAFLVSLFSPSIALQYITFFIVSLILLYFTRPIAVKYLKIGKNKTNYEELIGRTGLVIETIDNLKTVGQVKLGGQIWTARATTDTVILEGTEVVIVNIQGVKLIVEVLKEDKECTE